MEALSPGCHCRKEPNKNSTHMVLRSFFSTPLMWQKLVMHPHLRRSTSRRTPKKKIHGFKEFCDPDDSSYFIVYIYNN